MTPETQSILFVCHNISHCLLKYFNFLTKYFSLFLKLLLINSHNMRVFLYSFFYACTLLNICDKQNFSLFVIFRVVS